MKKTQNNNGNSSVDTKQLVQAAREMPQYQTLIKQYHTNINLAHQLITLFKQYKLQDIIDLEQDIVTGIDDNGHECNRVKIQQRLSKEVLSKDDIPQEFKLRLFMLYIIAQGGMKPNERKILVEQCKFDDSTNNIIFNFGGLGVALQNILPVEGHKNKEYWQAAQKYAKEKAKNSVMLTRYMSYFEWILKQYSQNKLSTIDFPWLRDPEKKDLPRLETYYRPRRPLQPMPRIIVYVLGGVSYSELRTVYQLSEELKRDIFVGSTAIINHKKYLKLLSVK